MKEASRVRLTPDQAELVKSSLRTTAKKFSFDHIGFLGWLGGIIAKEKTHDVDLVILPGTEAPLDQAITETFAFYDALENNLRKKRENVLLNPFLKKSQQEIRNHLIHQRHPDAELVPVHSMFYPSEHSVEAEPESYKKSLNDELESIYGDFTILQQINAPEKRDREPYLMILEYSLQGIDGKIPKDLLTKMTKSLTNYLHKYYGIQPLSQSSSATQHIDHILQQLDQRIYT